MSLNYVQVICDVFNGDGSAYGGNAQVAFSPNAEVTDAIDHQVVSTTSVKATFRGFGMQPTVNLLATDNANPAPSGWAWNVSFTARPTSSSVPAPFTFFLPAGPASFTATNASPCVFTWTPTASLTTVANDMQVTLAGGSLPTGFTASTYYVVNVSGATFELSHTLGGSPIASTGSGSGTFTVAAVYLSSLTPVSTAPPVTTYVQPMKVVTANTAGTLATSAFTDVDATSGPLTMTLPTSANGQLICVEKSDSTVNVVTISGSIRGGNTTVSLSYQKESMLFMSYSGSWWPIASHKPFSALDERYPRVYNPVYWGADPTGVADSTAAFNACILAVLNGNVTPGSTTRVPLGRMYIPAGTFTVTSDILIQSVQGFVFEGAGPELTIIQASGTGFTTAVINVDGSYAGTYKGFTIKGDTTEQVTNAFNLTWTTNAARSSTGNLIRDIRVRNLNYVNGISLMGIGARQVDGTDLENIVVAGRQTTGSWSNSGNWQAGFVFGNGTFGNIYDQVMKRCDAANHYYGYYCNVSSFGLYGAQPANNFTDFYVTPSAQVTISNIQSQNSGSFLVCPSNFAAIPCTVSDVTVKTSFFQGTSNQVITLAGGTWNFNNFNGTNLITSAVYQNGTIGVTGSSASRPCVVNFNNLSLFNDRVDAFTLSHAIVTVQGYSNYNPQTGNYTYATGDVSSFNQGGIWVNAGGITPPQVNFFTSNGSYTIPVGAQTIYAVVVGGGAGGSSGSLTASGSSGGGAGGGGGGYSSAMFQASQLTSPVSVTVGGGGNGASAIAVAGTPGSAGSAGVASQFGGYLWASKGTNAGAASLTNSAVSAGGLAGSGNGTAGAGGATTTGSGVAGGGSPQAATSGGGAGGGVNGTTAANGGPGGASTVGSSTGSLGGVVGGATPTVGGAPVQGCTTAGGGGGAAATSGTAQNGADALANTGGGGGGGGACSTGTASGAGGKGGSGFVLVIAYFQ